MPAAIARLLFRPVSSYQQVKLAKNVLTARHVIIWLRPVLRAEATVNAHLHLVICIKADYFENEHGQEALE